MSGQGPAQISPVSGARGLRLTLGSFTIVIAVSLVGGIAAALVGGPLSDLGSGAGGLYGVPSLLTTLIALLAAIPAAVGMARRARGVPGWVRAAALVAAGAWIVAIGYFVVAHAVDPCVNGWWDATSRIGDEPLCERYGSELNWHPRFHLLAHAVPAAILLGMYVWAIRRWATSTPPPNKPPSPKQPGPLSAAEPATASASPSPKSNSPSSSPASPNASTSRPPPRQFPLPSAWSSTAPRVARPSTSHPADRSITRTAVAHDPRSLSPTNSPEPSVRA